MDLRTFLEASSPLPRYWRAWLFAFLPGDVRLAFWRALARGELRS
jgi:hypothetical protein